jgi:hypothetical protein
LAVTIAIGIGSRLIHTGLPLIDKYLGDALYAVMFFVIFRLRATPAMAGWLAMAVVTGLELFQLTGIPMRMSGSDSLPVRLLARLLGTEFNFADFAAYVVGIVGARLASTK